MAKNHSDDEKIAVARKICELYGSQDATIESCCKANGITARTLQLWAHQISEISQLYKEAKSRAEETYWEEVIKPKARTALAALLEGGEVVETRKEDVFFQGIQIDGAVKKVVSARHVTPNASATIFSIKGLYPDKFGDRLDLSSKGKELSTGGDNWFMSLPLEKRLRIMKIATEETE